MSFEITYNKPLVPTRNGEVPLLAAQRRRYASRVPAWRVPVVRGVMFVGTLLALSVSAVAEESVQARAAKVTSKLEVLDNLGRECESHLQVESMKGASSAACTKFLKNIRGAYFDSIGEECASLSKWYESKRQLISKNPGFAEENPDEAGQLVKDMKAVNAACHPNSLASYKFLTKPLDTIKALGELE